MDDRPMEVLAAELLRALRGRRSQTGFSRLLGYRSNPVALWEAGQRFPTAAETLKICERIGKDINAAFARLFTRLPEVTPNDESVAGLMRALRHNLTIVEIAERLERSRYVVSRWLSGTTAPRLHDFLSYLDATTGGRAVDWVAALVSTDRLPAARELIRAKRALAAIVEQEPIAAAILHILETRPYRALKQHRRGWIARRLGIDPDVEARVVETFERCGVIGRVDGKLVARDTFRLYGSASDQGVQRKKQHWTRAAAERIPDPGPRDYFGYVVFAATAETLAAVRASLQREMRDTLARVTPDVDTECLAVVNLQVFELSGPD